MCVYHIYIKNSLGTFEKHVNMFIIYKTYSKIHFVIKLSHSFFSLLPVIKDMDIAVAGLPVIYDADLNRH